MGILWRESELEVIRKYYPDEGVKGCAEHLPGRTVKAIRQKAAEQGVYTSDEFKSRFLFKKGQQSPTKGMKLGAKPIHPNSKKNWYRKGLVNNGVEASKPGDMRYWSTRGWMIKLSERRWEDYHRHVWKKAYGDIPKTHHVAVKTGSLHNLDDIRAENLQLVDSAAMLRMYSDALPDDLKKCITTLSTLTKLINRGNPCKT